MKNNIKCKASGKIIDIKDSVFLGEDIFVSNKLNHQSPEVTTLCNKSELIFLVYYIKLMLLEEAEITKQNKTNLTIENFVFSKEYTDNRTHCWCCGTTGIHLQDYISQMLIAISTLELTTKDKYKLQKEEIIQKIKETCGIKIDETILQNINLDEEGQEKFTKDNDSLWLKKVNFDKFFKMTDKVILCPKCADKYNPKFKKDYEKANSKEVSEEEMEMVEKMYKDTLKPIAERLAIAELEIQKFKNNAVNIM